MDREEDSGSGSRKELRERFREFSGKRIRKSETIRRTWQIDKEEDRKGARWERVRKMGRDSGIKKMDREGNSGSGSGENFECDLGRNGIKCYCLVSSIILHL
ncbi:hypothetical protein LOAG_09437 [Loa loa]|uniref:Uncharacterized protein n=1 Tax=Loa loa TaxID=7209 RepID=A0A1S0TTH5_LOALO|nr:hypothetical protein LOAG_09437 [Loa loa]EFO19058.1 hypothetical protein LOAG_09437 [Loa loa]